jgi:hypothetical protein
MWQVQSMIAMHEVLTNIPGAVFEVSQGSAGNRLEFFIGHRARPDFSIQQLTAEQHFQSRIVLVHTPAAA